MKKIKFDEAKVGDFFYDKEHKDYNVLFKKGKTFFYDLEYIIVKILKNDGTTEKVKIYKHQWDWMMEFDYLL